MENMYYAAGVVAGIFVAGIAVLVKKFSAKEKQQFDERQIIARLRGYKLGFFTMMIFNAAYAIYAMMIEKPILNTDISMILSIVLGGLVFSVYVIWKDAYAELHKGRKNFLLLFGAVGLLNLLSGIRNLEDNAAIVESGSSQLYLLNFFASILCGISFLALAIKGLSERKEEE